jgi:hypothetical protein
MKWPMKWCAIPVLLVQVMSGGAKADFTSGNELWDFCQGDEPGSVKDTFCISYVIGAAEALVALQQAKQTGPEYCLPPHVQRRQVSDVVKLFLRDHPENRQNTAVSLVMLALKEKFPCN